MAIEDPIYLVIAKPTQGKVTWEEMRNAIEEWLPSTHMAHYSVGEWQDALRVAGDSSGEWFISVPHEVGQDRAIALADIIRKRFPATVVNIQDTVSGVMEPGDYEQMLAGEKPPIRRRGPLN